MISVKILGTPVRINFRALLIIVLVWGTTSGVGLYLHPGRELWQALLIGLVTTGLLLAVEFGHPLAHILSARLAGAPMDEVIITLDMPRTLYTNNDVSPTAHRLRAAGGPIYNVAGLALSLAVYWIGTGIPIVQELAGWSAFGHGMLLLMSLTPVPPVDGGVLLKWTLVARGKTEREADRLVRRVDWGIGIGAASLGAGLLALQLWIAGAILLVVSIVIIAVTVGKLH